MSTIDQRVVQMQFDNKQFEQGVSQSLSTLEKLKQALNLPDSSKGLDGLQKSLNNVDTSKLLNSIDEIGSHFTVVGRFIDRHVDQILDKMTNGVKNFVKGISVDQISAGMSKYEQYNESVQMIKSALPEKSVQDIEEVMSRLNEYTDLTSYSFTEMSKSIGKFTSQGIDLETSEIAMEGIANWAASAGGNIKEANIAMYNLSQALAVGALKKQDWNSLAQQNLTTKEFKEEAIKAAIALGVLQDAGNGAGYYLNQTKRGIEKVTINFENMGESLKSGWFNTNVLLKVLAEYADRESEVGKKGFEMAKVAITWKQAVDAIKDAISTGWMKTFKYLLGDLDEAGKLFTRVSDAIIDFALGISEWRNELLKAWHEQGGYNDAIETAANIWHIFLDIVDMVRNALASVFPPVTVETLLSMTKNAREFTQSLRDIFDTLSGKKIEVEGEFPTEEAEGFFGVLKKGMQGDEVKQLQTWLEQLGYDFDNFGLDGKFGSETEKALKSFQKDSGIKEDGIFGKQSWDALQKRMLGVQETAKEILPTTPLEKFDKMLVKGDRGEGVKKLQQHLIDLGYLTDQSMADGIFGPQTQAALKKFQEDAQLEQKYPGFVANGDYGYDTWWAFKELLYDTADAAEKVHERIDVMAKVRDNMSNFIGGAVSVLSNAFNILTIGGEGALKILGALWDVVAPFVGVLVDLAGVVMGLFSKVDLSFPVLVAVGGVVSIIQNALAPVADLTNSMTSSFTNFLKKAKKFETFGEFWTGLQEELGKSNVWNGLLSALSSIGEFLAMLGPLAMAFFGTAASYIGSGLVIAFEWLATNVPIVINTISNGISKVIDYVSKSGIINTVFNGLLGVLKVIGGLFGLIGVGAMALFDAISKAAGAVWDFLTKNKVLTKTLEKIQKFFSPITNFFKHVRKSFTYFKNSGKKFNLDNFLDYLSRFRDDSAPITKALKAIVNGIKAIGGVALVAVAGIVGLAIAIKNGVVSLWNFITGSEKLKSVFDGIKKFFDPVITFFSALPRAIMDLNKQGKKITLGNILQQIYKNFLKDGNNKAAAKIMFLRDRIVDIISTVEGFYKAVKKFFIGAWESISDWYDKNLKPIVDRVGKFFTDLYDKIKAPEDVTNPIERIKIAFQNLLKLIGGKLGEAFQRVRDFFTFDENLSFGENIKNKLSVIGGWFGDLGQTIKEKFVEFYNNSTYLKPAIEKLKEYGAIVKDWFENKFGSAIDWFNDHIVPIWDKITAFFTDLYDKIKAPDDVTDPIERIKIAFQNLFGLIAGKFVSAWDKIKEFFTFDPNLSFVENIQQKFGQLKDIFSTVGDTIKDKILEIYNNSPFLQQAFEKIKGFLAPLIDKLKGFVEIINQMLHGDFSGVTSLLEKIGGAFGGLWESITGKAGEIGSGLGKKFDIFGKIKDFFGKFKGLNLKDLIGPALTGLGLYSLFNFSRAFKDMAKGYKAKQGGGLSDIFDKMANGVLKMVFAITILSLIDQEKAFEGIKMLVGLMEHVMALFVIAKIAGAEDIGKSMNQFGIGIIAIAGAVALMTWLIANSKAEDRAGAIATIIGMFASMLVLIGVYNYAMTKFGASSSGTVDGLMQMCVGILLLVVAVGLLTVVIDRYGGDDVMGAFAIVELMLITLWAIAFLVAKFSPTGGVEMKGFLALAGAIAILVIAIAAIATMLAIFKNGEVWQAFVIIEILLITLGAAAVLMAAFAPDWKRGSAAMVLVVVLALAIAGLALVMGHVLEKIKDVDWKIALVFMGGMVALLGVTAIIVSALGAIPIPLLVKGMVALLGLILIVALGLELISGALMDAMDKVGSGLFMFGSSMSDFSNFMEDCNIEIMTAMCNFIKDTLVPTVWEIVKIGGKYDDIYSAGQALFILGTQIGLYNTAVSDIDVPKLEAISQFIIEKLIPSTLAMISIAAFAEPISTAGGVIQTLGANLQLYHTSLSGISDVSSLVSVSNFIIDNLVPSVTSLAPIGDMGGSIRNAGSVIQRLGANFKMFSTSLTGINTAEFPDIRSIADDAEYVATKIAGLGDTSGLSDTLNGISGAMEIYFQTLKGAVTEDTGEAKMFDSSAVNAAFNSIAEIQISDDVLAKFGAYADKDSSGLSNFATGIANIASALGSYGENISGINLEQAQAANDVLDTIGNISEKLSKPFGEDGDVESNPIYGKQTVLSSFATDITELGSALNTYATDISPLKDAPISEANTVMNDVADVFTKLSAPFGETSDITQNPLYGQQTVLSSFATDITELGNAIGTYGTSIGELDKDKIGLANDVMDKAVDIKDKLNKKGMSDILTSWIVGKSQDLASFGTDLAALGNSLKDYGNSIGDLSYRKINTANHALTVVSTISKSLPNNGGILSWIVGDNSLGKFASNMSRLGDGIANYGNKTAGADFSNVEASLPVIETVGDMLSKIEKQGGIKGWWEGKKNLGDLTAGMGTAGTNIANFVTNAGSITKGQADEALAIIEKITGFANSIDWKTTKTDNLSKLVKDYGTVLDELAKLPYREVDVDSGWGKNMVNSLEAAQETIQSLGDILTTGITTTTATSPITSIETLLNDMLGKFDDKNDDFKSKGTDIINKIVAGLTERSEYAKRWTSMLLSAMKFRAEEYLKGNTFSKVGIAIVDSLVDGFVDRSEAAKKRMGMMLSAMKFRAEEYIKNPGFKDIGTSIVNSLVEGLTARSEYAKRWTSMLLSAMKFRAQEYVRGDGFTNIGKSIVTSIANGIRANTDKTKLAISIILSAAKQTVRNWESKFYDVAAWIDHGLAQGMRDNVWRVQNAVSYIAHEAIVKFCQESAIQSPSKVFAWAGQMMDMGLVQGLVAYSSNVSDASASVADDAMNSVREGLKGYSSSLADNMDTVPTIRPVLDLSEVQNGINGINGMFGTQQIGVRSANMATAIGVKDAQIAEIKANSSEIGLAASISELNDRVNDLGERIANMRIVMNGDRLVGEIVDPLDRALGRRKVRR